MLQVRKLCFCGIYAIFFHCCFMNETQVLMAVSRFFCSFFSRNNSLEEGFTFHCWGPSFLSEEGVWGEGHPMGGIGFSGGVPGHSECLFMWKIIFSSPVLYTNKKYVSYVWTVLCLCILPSFSLPFNVVAKTNMSFC